MSKQSGKNPYVHPKEYPDGTRMLNTVGNDGWSFDEKDDDEYDENGFVIDKEKSDMKNDRYEEEYGVSKEEYDEIMSGIRNEKNGRVPMGPEHAEERRAMADAYNHLSESDRARLTDEELCNLYDAEMIEKDLADDDEFE